MGGPNSTFSPEYDDPANCGDEEPYGSQYGSYGAPYDHFGSRNSVGRRSFGKCFLQDQFLARKLQHYCDISGVFRRISS